MTINKQTHTATINNQLTKLSSTITSDSTISDILDTIQSFHDIHTHLDILQYEATLSLTQTLIAENLTHYLQPDIDLLITNYL